MKNIGDKVQVRKRTYKSGNSVWEYRFEGITTDAKPRNQISKSGFKSAAEAEKEGKKAFAIYYKYCHDDKEINFEDFVFDIWMPHAKAVANWKDTTTDGYIKRIRNYLVPYIGKKNIDDILPVHIERLLNGLYRAEDGLCYTTISDLHSILNAIFTFAVANRYIGYSPMTTVRVPKRKAKDREVGKQVREVIPAEILNAIFVRFPEGTVMHLPMKIALLAGLRLGEVFGLAWCDVDFENNLLHIRRQYQVASDGDYVCNPKYDSKRDVPMCNELRDLLLKTKEKQDSDKKNNPYYLPVHLEQKRNEFGNVLHEDEFYVVYGEGEDEIEFVNRYPGGKLATPANARDTARVIHGYDTNYKKTKIKHINDAEHPFVYEAYNFHSLRHTFASRLREKGVPEIVIGNLLGHSGKGHTTSRYLHMTPEEFAGVKDIMDK